MLSNKILVSLVAVLLSMCLTGKASGQSVQDVYGDEELHQLEAEIVSLAERSGREKLGDIEFGSKCIKLVERLSDPEKICTLMRWAELNKRSGESEDDKLFSSYMYTLYHKCLRVLKTIPGPKTADAIIAAAHDLSIYDSSICEAIEKVLGKRYIFPKTLYCSYYDECFYRQPITPQCAQFRFNLARLMLKQWNPPVFKKDVYADVDCVVDKTGRFSINDSSYTCHEPRFYKVEGQELAGKAFEKAALKAILGAKMESPLPNGFKKVRVQIRFSSM